MKVGGGFHFFIKPSSQVRFDEEMRRGDGELLDRLGPFVPLLRKVKGQRSKFRSAFSFRRTFILLKSSRFNFKIQETEVLSAASSKARKIDGCGSVGRMSGDHVATETSKPRANGLSS